MNTNKKILNHIKRKVNENRLRDKVSSILEKTLPDIIEYNKLREAPGVDYSQPGAGRKYADDIVKTLQSKDNVQVEEHPHDLPPDDQGLEELDVRKTHGDKRIENPATGNQIKLRTALKAKKGSAAYTKGKAMYNALKDKPTNERAYASTDGKPYFDYDPGEGKLTESMIGIKTKANFKPLQLKGALERAGIKGYQMNRLSVTLTALKIDKKDFNNAKKIIDGLGLSVMMAKEGKLNEGGKVTRNMWNRMSDDEKIDALQTAFSDPDDAMKHYEKEWNNLPSVATQNMYIESKLNEDHFKKGQKVKYQLDRGSSKALRPSTGTISKIKKMGNYYQYTIQDGGPVPVWGAEIIGLAETKSAPAGHYFTKGGNVVKGRLSKAARAKGATTSDPKDKQRSKVPPATQRNEGEVNEMASRAQVTKAFSEISKLSVAMLLNIEKFKAAKAKGDEKAIAKHRKLAMDMQTKKKKMEADLEKMIAGIDKNVELVMDETIDMDKIFMKGRKKKRTTDESKLEESFVDHFLDKDENKDNNINFSIAIQTLKSKDINKNFLVRLAKKLKVDPKDALRFVREMFSKLLENELKEGKLTEANIKFTFDKDNLGDQVRAQVDIAKRNPKKTAEQFIQDLIAASKSGKFKYKTWHPNSKYKYLKAVGKLFSIQGIKVPKFADTAYDKIKSVLGEGKLLKENKYVDQLILYPTVRKYGMGKQESLLVWKVTDRNEAHTISSNLFISRAYEDDVKHYLKKYGKPTAKEIKADKAVYDLFWKTARKLGRTGYKLAGWRNYGQGNVSDLAYVYSGKGLYEIYLNLPRAYRHQDEQNLSDEYIKFFDMVEQEVSMIEKKIKSMGFRVQISASPSGYRG